MALKYAAQLDRKARAWNVVDTTTDQIVGMFGGGVAGERQARRSADNHNQQWLEDGLAEYDAEQAAVRRAENAEHQAECHRDRQMRDGY